MTSTTRLEKLKEMFQNASDLAGNGQQVDEVVLAKLKNICDELDKKTDEVDNVCVNNVPTMAEFLTELKVLETTGSLLGKFVREFQITGGQMFSSDYYAEKLRAKLSINHEEIDWMLMTSNVVPIINRAPGIHMLVGSFDNSQLTATPKKAPNKKPIKVERGEQEYGEKRAPSKVESMEVDNNSVGFKVDYLMKNLHRCYKENGNNPISFYKFILHPCNFTTTVENIFHISFIMRDGLARLDIVDDDIVIEPSNESKPVDGGNGPAAIKYQMVFSISMDEWKNLIEFHDIQEALIE